MDKKQVLDKIQKLLSLANSSNEHEAKLAADRANELLTRYNLSMQDIKEGREYSSVKVGGGARRKFHHELVFSLLMEFFFIEIVQSRRKGIRGFIPGEVVAIFIGEEHNVKIAKYIFDFLVPAMERGWKAFKAKYEAEGYGGLTAHKKSYYTGLYLGLQENLEKTRKKVEQEAGLVVVKDPGIKDHIDDMFDKPGDAKALSTDTRGGIAMKEGYEQGKETQIAMGLDSGKESSYIGEAPLKLTGQKGE